MNLRFFSIIICMCALLSFSGNAIADDIVISGIVKNKTNKKKMNAVSLTVPGTNIGTVSNSDGSFTLKIPDTLLKNGIKAEQIGYRTSEIGLNALSETGKPISYTNKTITIWLEPVGKLLDEVTIYGAEPRALVETALKKIPYNYSTSQNMFSSFYRETIQKGKRYIGVTEAIADVFKKPYKTRSINGDKVQIIKGRRLVSHNDNDTIAVKIMGGPTMPVVLDIVKNEDVLFSIPELDLYEFKMAPMTSIDDRIQFVVEFKPAPYAQVNYPLNIGRIYIDQETISITKAEYEVDMSDKNKATRVILYKKPRGLHFKPQELECVVSYKYQDGISYLNYIRTKTRFKCDWKRRLFSSSYTIYAEMVMVDRDDSPTTTISSKDAFGKRDIFSDMVDNFNDTDFWKDYNIIEPTESLEKAVTKLKK